MEFNLLSLDSMSKIGMGFNCPPVTADSEVDDRAYCYMKAVRIYFRRYNGVFLVDADSTNVKDNVPALFSGESKKTSGQKNKMDGELVWAHQINEEEQMHQKMDDNATYCGCAAQILKACTIISDQIRLEFPQEEFSLQNQNTQHAGSQPACTVTKTKPTSQMLRVDICDNPFQTSEQVMTEKCHCTRPHPAQTR